MHSWKQNCCLLCLHAWQVLRDLQGCLTYCEAMQAIMCSTRSFSPSNHEYVYKEAHFSVRNRHSKMQFSATKLLSSALFPWWCCRGIVYGTVTVFVDSVLYHHLNPTRCFLSHHLFSKLRSKSVVLCALTHRTKSQTVLVLRQNHNYSALYKLSLFKLEPGA